MRPRLFLEGCGGLGVVMIVVVVVVMVVAVIVFVAVTVGVMIVRIPSVMGVASVGSAVATASR